MDPQTVQRRRRFKYSVVIPVFNSAPIVGQTVDRTVAFFEEHGLDYELILVNDGSADGSWDVIREKSLANPRIVAIDLLKNYGQHNAVLCGFQHSSGEYVITLDDDLQNPPEEIIRLIDRALEGYDVVFGRFREKKHAWYRRLGSRIVAWINRRVFDLPKDLVLTNFRIATREVVDRVLSYQTGYPYVPGLLLMFSRRRANVWVEHRERPVGKSNYNPLRIARLVMRILFNYSAFPLQLMSVVGLIVSVLSFAAGTYYLARALFIGVRVPGWTTLVVLVSFFNGVNTIILSMLGEYVIRLVRQFSSSSSYYIREIVRAGGRQ